MYTGNESIYTYTFEHQQKPECPVCGGESTEVTRPQESTLQDLIDYLLEKQDLYVFSLSSLFPLSLRRAELTFWSDVKAKSAAPPSPLDPRTSTSKPPLNSKPPPVPTSKRP